MNHKPKPPQAHPPKSASPARDASAMWGGRFASGPDAVMEAINASIGFDRRFHAEDIAGSRAHAAMLAKQGIVSVVTGSAEILEPRRALH